MFNVLFLFSSQGYTYNLKNKSGIHIFVDKFGGKVWGWHQAWSYYFWNMFQIYKFKK
jgi:hypothetical protein